MRRLLLTILAATQLLAAGPDHVDITWMSISNMYYEIGNLGVITDGYFTRIPQSEFYGPGGGLGSTHHAWKPDVDAVQRVMQALGGPQKVNLLLTGHSHFDHSFDTATWSKLTGASIIGSQTTCFQAMAEQLPRKRCKPVFGGEKITLSSGVTMRVVRWNHSGDPAVNPEQHNAVELDHAPMSDALTGGLHAGVAEDFPNGGGNRAFLFTVDGPRGRYSWFFQNSASAVDLAVPIIVNGKNYGAPLDNLKAAMHEAGLTRVDLWIGTGGAAAAQLVVPILKPKTFLPVHWDGLWSPFFAGVPAPYADRALGDYLQKQGVAILKPTQYMDKWRLGVDGVVALPNDTIKRSLGLDDR